MKTARTIFALLTFCFVGLFGYVTGGYADTIYVKNYGDGSCSLANAQSAYAAAHDNDTIIFPSGICTWASTLTISKPVRIIGAGSGTNGVWSTGGTKLISSGALNNGLFHVTGITSTIPMRISGFYFEMTNMTSFTAIMVTFVALDSIRIDHNTFNQGDRAIHFENPKGLIDNNYFYNGNLTIEFTAGTNAQANASWASMAAGTAEALFIEDNNFIDDANFLRNYTNERIGTFNGGKLVVRYNHFYSKTIPDAALPILPFMTHGSAAGGVAYGYWQAGTGARRGQSVVEIYNNLFEGKRIDFPVIVRGSANLIYNNVIGKVQYSPRIYLREEEYDGGQWTPTRLAWPAEDQVHNTFIWNNTSDGTQMGATNIAISPSNDYCNSNANPWVCCTGPETGACNDFIKKDRDYFLHAPCGASDTVDAYGNTCTHGKETFTGQNGAAGSYPTDGVKYPTRGTMVFSATGDNAYYGYTPYTYPHPLTVLRPPNIPTTTTVP